jgi:hypothetical protein
MVGLTIFNTMNQRGLVMQADERQLAAEQVALEMKALKLESRLTYCANPIMIHLLNKDPFDQSQYLQLYELKNAAPPIGSVMIIDPDFAPMVFRGDSVITMNIGTDFREVVKIPVTGDIQQSTFPWRVSECVENN